MNTTGLIILVVIVLVIQIVLFLAGRRLRKKEKQSNVLLKYDINSRADAWRIMADPDTPEDDRKKIEELFNDDEKGGER